MTQSQTVALAANKANLINFVNVQGSSLISLVQSSGSSCTSNCGQSIQDDTAYSWMPRPLTWFSTLYGTVTTTSQITYAAGGALSAAKGNGGGSGDNLSHFFWHGYFTGPDDWGAIYYVLAYSTADGCTVTNGPTQSCKASMLLNFNTVLSAEICYDGIDNDGNGLIDKQDPA